MVTPDAVFNKGVLTRIGDQEREAKGMTIPGTRQGSTGCESRGGDFDAKAKGSVY